MSSLSTDQSEKLKKVPRLPSSPSSLLHRPFLLTAILLLTTLTLSGCALLPNHHAEKLAPFASDGCSLFPDGTLEDTNKWCDCCQTHDLAYWQGGSADERDLADAALRACVLARTDNEALADTLYHGVRAGGHPAFPTWYRWGFGWPYGRGYQPLTRAEKRQVKKRLKAYKQEPSTGYCGE